MIGASWLWVIMAFLLAQLAYVASAVESIGSVPGPLPFGRVLGAEVAKTFSALAGGTAAIFATRVRFFQQQGYDASAALSSGAIMTTVSWVTTLVLLVVRCRLPGDPSTSTPDDTSAETPNSYGSSSPPWCWPRWPPGHWRCPDCAG